jgi:hypothetical protein
MKVLSPLCLQAYPSLVDGAFGTAKLFIEPSMVRVVENEGRVFGAEMGE